MTDKRNEQRQRLLQAAYDLVAEVGVSGLRTRDIAERAGVNIATLHYCFTGKDALLSALFDFIRDKFRAESQQRLGHITQPEERIIAQTELRMHFLREQPHSIRAWRAFIGEAWTNSTIRDIVRRFLAEQRERYAATLASGRESGVFPNLPSADDRVAASMLMALYDGMLFQAAMDPDAFAMEDYGRAIHAWLGMDRTDIGHTGTTVP